MQTEFFPNIEYNRKRRTKLLVFYILLMLLPGGFGVYLFFSGQSTMGLLMGMLILLLLSMIPSSLAQYPVKKKPLIQFDGKNVKFPVTKQTVKASDITAVSICMEVPQISKIPAENKAFLQKIASEKPTESVLGACDVSIINEKGKEVVIYNIVDDCITALEQFLSIGVKKYRIVYSQKKLVEEASYKMCEPGSGEVKLSDLSDREKMMQLM